MSSVTEGLLYLRDFRVSGASPQDGSRVRDPGPGTGPGMRTCSEYQLYHIIEVPLRLKNFTY